MELQALGPATIQDEKSTLQKTVVFCLVSFFFFFYFFFVVVVVVVGCWSFSIIDFATVLMDP